MDDSISVLFWFLLATVTLIGGSILMSTSKFPFQLEDLAFWIVKRKDGTTVKYSLTDSTTIVKSSGRTQTAFNGWSSYESHTHEPHPATDLPVFSADNIGLWIADSAGAKKVWTDFDVAIDGGFVLPIFEADQLPNMWGDMEFRSKLAKHVQAGKAEPVTTTKVIKLRWYDREAPPVWASFWPALTEELKLMAAKKAESGGGLLRVLTICQGGHGRSGTALTALMMCLSDYSPLEALTHIRAIHCSRAIESKVQHLYLNALACELDRPDNALEAENISSFREAFQKLESATAAPYKSRLTAPGVTKEVSRKDDPFCAM